ncbi:hypothetical protein MB14_00440 [Roseivirga ehrenbergii]|uniref:Uncharacterized protein n=2 Tax=Roseivirga ehrenbergii (strain DSM 102268 / JCM 13514 / KCTC 12282 / NCIMB 14502 / KMM 6017) TaxID=279360 RepID=A0A150XT81_ROSEK|nr:hypothetical protein MB14_00440 [Roseivirga ehrenbergii]
MLLFRLDKKSQYLNITAMSKYLLTLSIICLSFGAYAQYTSEVKAVQIQNTLISQQNAALKGQKLIGMTLYDLDFERSPLVYPDWQLGAINFKTDQRADSMLLNIDASINALVFKISAEYNPFRVDSDKISGFILYGTENKTFVQKYTSDFKELKNELLFFEILFESENFSILKQETKRIVPADSQLRYTSATEDKYRVDVNYFFRMGTDLYEDVSLNKKGFKTMASDSQYDQIQDFVKKNKLKWGDEADMIKVFKEFF